MDIEQQLADAYKRGFAAGRAFVKESKKPKAHKTLADYPADAVDLSHYLRKLILAWKPNAIVPKDDTALCKWAEIFGRMLTADKRNADKVAEVIEWATSDETFWRTVILSAKSVREQYDRIEAKMMCKNGKREREA